MTERAELGSTCSWGLPGSRVALRLAAEIDNLAGPSLDAAGPHPAHPNVKAFGGQSWAATSSKKETARLFFY